MTGMLVVLGMLGIVATLLPLVRHEAWWIRVFDFPRLQVAVLLAAILVAFLWFARPLNSSGALFVAALLGCLLYQAYTIFPFTPLAAKQVQRSVRHEPRHSLRLLFANVLMDNRNAAGLLRIVGEADPDVILTLEVDEWWVAQLQTLNSGYPYVVSQPQSNTYGMLLQSRLRLIDPRIAFLVEDDVPSIHVGVHLPGGPRINLHCVHPRPPVPGKKERSTERDAELVLIGKSVKDERDPVVVMGDLNDVAWSRTSSLFRRISGLMDPRIGRGFYNTFHAQYPLIRFPLDHFFHSNDFRLIDFRRLGSFGSDHFPVYIALSYEPQATAEQAEPQADASDRHEADEKIRKADA